MSLLTGVAVALGVLLAVVAAELGAASVVRRRSEDALAGAMGGTVRVHLRDRPVLAALVRRRLRRVRIVARHVPVGDSGGTISRLDVHLTGVQVLPAASADGSGPGIRADDARFVARLSSADIAAIIHAPPGVQRLELTTDGLRIRTATGVAVTTSLLARDGDLVIRADRGLLAVLPRAELVIPLHDLPAGATVEEARVQDGELVARGRLDGDRLHAG